MARSDDKNRDRRAEILDAAFALLGERGYRGTTMLAVAERAGASKETLYAWFGDKAGLFEALVLHHAEAMNRALGEALADPGGDPRARLEAFGVDLLTLLLGGRSLAVNRAAMAEAAGGDAELGRLLVAKGRRSTGPLVVAFLAEQQARGRLRPGDPGEAFEVFLGLLTRDWQIRTLLGEMKPPGRRRIAERSRQATALFLRLYGTGRGG